MSMDRELEAKLFVALGQIDGRLKTITTYITKEMKEHNGRLTALEKAHDKIRGMALLVSFLVTAAVNGVARIWK